MNSGEGSASCSADAFLRTDWLDGELAEAGLTDGAGFDRVRLVVFAGSWKWAGCVRLAGRRRTSGACIDVGFVAGLAEGCGVGMGAGSASSVITSPPGGMPPAGIPPPHP